MNIAASRATLLGLAMLSLAIAGCSKQAEKEPSATAKPPAAPAATVEVLAAASPLARAASRGDLPEVKALVAAGANVNVTDALGRTPLHMAAFYGRTKVSDCLLTSGADIHARDRVGMTPLHAAVLAGARQEMELLLDRKADVNAATDAGQTPLHLAAATGQPKM